MRASAKASGCDGKVGRLMYIVSLRFGQDLIDRLVQERLPRSEVRLREARHDGLAGRPTQCRSALHLMLGRKSTYFFVTVIKSCVLR